MDVGMGLVEERDLLIHPSDPGPVGQVHRATGGSAAPRTGATSTGSKRSHEHQRDADDGEPGCKASHPGEKGEKPHHLKPPLAYGNKYEGNESLSQLYKNLPTMVRCQK